MLRTSCTQNKNRTCTTKKGHKALNLARLPVPPPGYSRTNLKIYSKVFMDYLRLDLVIVTIFELLLNCWATP